MQKKSNSRHVLQIVFFIISVITEIMFLGIIYNLGELLIGRSFLLDEVKSFLQGSAFLSATILFCLATLFLILSMKNMPKWEIYPLVILTFTDFVLMSYFIYKWFAHVWIKHPPTCFGLGYLVGFIIILLIPMIIKVCVIVSRLTIKSQDQKM